MLRPNRLPGLNCFVRDPLFSGLNRIDSQGLDHVKHAEGLCQVVLPWLCGVALCHAEFV